MDIITLPHPTSRTHMPMSVSDRAAQFASFAALKGYESSIDSAIKEVTAIQAAPSHTDPYSNIEEMMEEILSDVY